MSASTSKVLVVGMDGLRFDRLIALEAPVLAGLMSAGAYGTSKLPYGEAGTPRTESPGEIVPKTPEPGDGGRVIKSRTDSGPGWSSIATGAWPDKHGVVDNGFAAAQFQKFPDFLSRAKHARPDLTTAAFFSWASLAEHGAFGPAIDHRFVLDGYTVGWAAADKQVTEAAERHLAAGDPGAVFVYLGDTDEVAHDLGPHCAEYTAALQAQDAYLGRLLDAVRARPSYREERWTVIVTTDHGHVDEGGHGGTSDEERTVFVIVHRLGADLGGRALAGPRLVDVAPTALAALGVAVDPAWDLDGMPLDT
ncbi:Type I phosphodiesterase / nucleotide pyrophosphatase [Nonomuraea solani]|uniref:Type I phosphodiesterase / nucleotide pyrophosphatase n=1 Tax=Nonomuraea solani TaxID=1144553 RepID=A0A1H5ZFU3_9ACTN|nr:alkaline phosphatase family protein [Nonomuraea solani]SEG35339.1 Type I phosphodiesterase / nucleotide pyrophosphatase [Nonomuraea solani]